MPEIGSESLVDSGKSRFDFSAFLEVHRKNLAALSEVQSLAMEAVQALARYQAETLSKDIGKNAEMIGEIWAQKSPELKFAKYTDFAEKSYRESVANCEKAVRLLNQSGMEAADILNNRVSSSLMEFKSALKPKGERINRKKAA